MNYFAAVYSGMHVHVCISARMCICVREIACVCPINAQCTHMHYGVNGFKWIIIHIHPPAIHGPRGVYPPYCMFINVVRHTCKTIVDV